MFDRACENEDDMNGELFVNIRQPRPDLAFVELEHIERLEIR